MRLVRLERLQTVLIKINNTKLPYYNSMGVLYYDIGIIGDLYFHVGGRKNIKLRKGFHLLLGDILIITSICVCLVKTN